MEGDSFILELDHICKDFPGVRALNDITFRVKKGEIHALVGENGAGKSTLMNILAGVIPKDRGDLFLDGKKVEIDSPRKALHLGISMIHQELALIPLLTVGQNIFLGKEPVGWTKFFVNWKKLYLNAKNELAKLDMFLDPKIRVIDLPMAQQQMVEIAKTLSLNARIIIMDEPTSSLSEVEIDSLFKVMRNLKNQGITIIYISHRLEEVFTIADRISVLRDGELIGSASINDIQPEEVVRMMVGRPIKDMFPKKAIPSKDVVLKIANLASGREVRDINLELHKGEILGIAGLIGSGRSALARAIFGIDPISQGSIWVEGKEVRINSPRDAMRLGLGLVPEDRKEQGLFLSMAVRENITIGILERLSFWGFLNFREISFVTESFVSQLNIRTPDIKQRVSNLSGGNQQKVIIAKWLSLNPKILIMDEPTKGIDVGAKAEIYALMDKLAESGVGVIMISSDLPEILGICDRILVMRKGMFVGEFARHEATQAAIMHYAAAGGVL